jgi:cholesterol oxidase
MEIAPFRQVTVLSGVGVGGGSLVYGNTLYVPHSDDFYRHEQWSKLADWRKELAPHFATAERMLGVTPYRGEGPSERTMRKIAADLGVADSVHNTNVGVYFGERGKTVPDPYFDGRGPERTGCVRCGQCMLGRRYGAKNTLDTACAVRRSGCRRTLRAAPTSAVSRTAECFSSSRPRRSRPSRARLKLGCIATRAARR